MSRDEEMRKAAYEWYSSDAWFRDADIDSFIEGARWADEHPNREKKRK